MSTGLGGSIAVARGDVHISTVHGLYVWRPGEGAVRTLLPRLYILAMCVCNERVYVTVEKTVRIYDDGVEVDSFGTPQQLFSLAVADDVVFGNDDELCMFKRGVRTVLYPNTLNITAHGDKVYALASMSILVFSTDGTSRTIECGQMHRLCFVGALMCTSSTHWITVWTDPPVHIPCTDVCALLGGSKSLYASVDSSIVEYK